MAKRSGDDDNRPSSSIPSPQRKRQRGDLDEVISLEPEAEPASEPEEVLLVESPQEMVPCEICGVSVAFSEFTLHMSIHDQHQADTQDVESEDVTCDVCGEVVPFDHFMDHSKKHRNGSTAAFSSTFYGGLADVCEDGVACEVCGVWMSARDLEDHLAAHKIHDQWLDKDMKTSNSAVDITAQLVEMARAGGAGLPGNRRNVALGDSVLVRWSDGCWYGGRVRAMQGPDEDKISVVWDPPYAQWAPERVSEQAVIPRMTQPREVCNFDVALEFVNKLCSMRDRSRQATKLEVVYHWTGEENVQKIVENNLKPPGSTNADGTAVQVVNGEAYGKGIYAATDMNYGRGFGRGLSCAFLCLAIPGHLSQGSKLSSNADCLKNGSLRVYRSSEQVLPLFFTDANSSANLSECARNIANLLKERVLGQLQDDEAQVEFRVGSKVEAYWQNAYYKAEVVHVHRDGTYDLRWRYPYHAWPGERRVSADRLRRRS